MSIKKLFGVDAGSRNYLTDTTEKDGFKDLESSKNLKQLKTNQDTFLPSVNYSNPKAFAKFGSAYLYYKSAIERIIDFYPYDGALAEKNEFYNKSLDIEKYIFNERYPRSTGYITFCSGTRGWGGLSGEIKTGGYGLPSSTEYITFYGGPNVASNNKTLKQMMPNANSSKFQNNNIYDTSLYATEGLPDNYGSGSRESNLKSNFDNGVTVEFWMQTGSLSTAKTEKQVILDVWNNEASSSADYGRITIELDNTTTSSPFLITAQSGAASASNAIFTSSIGTGINRASLDSWKHYAVSLYNSGNHFIAKLYVDGVLDDKNTYSNKKLGELESKNMIGRLGALLTAPSGTATGGTLPSSFAGAGKLSGSLDEFRFWKIARDAGQVGKYWFDQVGGGVNTDISNTTLGMYYKFNEGITGYSTTDSVILDYGGRLCNGTWTGYLAQSRNTGSAILSASAAIREYEEPIVYPAHPDVAALKEELLGLGTYHDGQNVSIFKNLLPAWILEDSDISQNTNLDKVFHIAGAYFDKLHLQISAIPDFKHLNYTSASHEPLPFAQHLPQSLGLYTPEIFVDSTIIEKFLDRNETDLFEGKVHEIKNLIYSNLYNNLAHIYKAKGTEKAIRNVLRCFNLDDNLITYNVYSNNQLFELKNNLKQTLKKKAFANFNTNYNNRAVIYQSADPGSADAKSFISCSHPRGTSDSEYFEDRHGLTVEASVVFPKFIRELDTFDRDFLSSSIFGMHTAITSSGQSADTTWVSGGSDWANFQVYAVRDEKYSKNAYFILTSSNNPHAFPTITSSVFTNIYDNNNWNISVGLKPTKYKTAGVITGSSDYTYEVIFRGESNLLGTVQDSFKISSSISQTTGKNIARAAKRPYIGAYKTNITGAWQNKTDVLFAGMKYWTTYLDDKSSRQHIVDKENYGISGSWKNVSSLDPATKNIDVFNFNNLALNWYFGNVTSSDASGEFYVTDLSSGSALIRNNFGLVGRTTGYLHTGKGQGFLPNTIDGTTVVKNKYVNEFKFIDPERAVGSDMVQILDQDDDLIEFVEQVPNYIYTIEKSMYSAISEEILDFFAGVIDFHHFIGQPVNRYRSRYKSLEALRRIFFERFDSVTKVEKFTEYYKWFDDAISIIIAQLVPASADFVADTYNTVESHVLERPKYKTMYPTLDFKAPDPEGEIDGIVEVTTPWAETPVDGAESAFSHGASPAGSEVVASSPASAGMPMYGGADSSKICAGLEDRAIMPPLPPVYLPVGYDDPMKYRPAYWQKYSQPNINSVNSSGKSNVDAARSALQKVMHRHTMMNLATSPVLSKEDGTQYKRDISIVNRTKGVYRYAASLQKPIHGGVNFEQSKHMHYAAAALYPAGPVNRVSDGFGMVFIPKNVLLALVEDLAPGICGGVYEPLSTKLNKKIKRSVRVQSGRDWEDGIGYYNLKSNFVFPFNIMSSSVVSGYNYDVINKVTSSITITNVHNDVYGDDKERPMQGPWSEYAAGGHQSRHVPLNRSGSGNIPLFNGLDDYTSRPEAWKILLGRQPNVTGALGMVGADYPWPEGNEVGQSPYPMTASQKAVYYRDFTAKTPYVFKNILLRTSSLGGTILGNYRRNYEIVHSVGTTQNPRQFIETQPTMPSQLIYLNATSATQVRTFLDIHRSDGWLPAVSTVTGTYGGYTGSHFKFIDEYSVSYLTGTLNDSIICSRFSNPGGLEVSTPGYRNFKGDEYSVYNTPNYRNLTVIKPSQGSSGSHSETTGAGGPGIRVSDIHTDPITKIGKDYGLRSHLSRHANRFFRDSLFVTGTEATPGSINFPGPPRYLLAPGASYEQWPAFHRVHRNNIDRNNICGNEIHGPYKIACSDGAGATLGNTRAAYWTSDDNRSIFVNTSSGTGVLNSPETSGQKFISGSRSNGGLSFSAWMRFTPTTEATDDVDIWGIGQTRNNDSLFHMHKLKTAPSNASTCAGSGSGNALGFKLSTRSTAAPTPTGTRAGIQYRAYVSGTAPNDILNQPGWRHIVVSLTGTNGSLAQTLSCSFYIDGIKQHTCRNDTNSIQNYYDQALSDWGTTGFMTYGAGDSFDFSDTANYRGDEFLVVGGNGHAGGTAANAFSGAMDNVTFWTKALTDTDVAALFNGGTPCDITCSALHNESSSYLHAWYPLGEGYSPTGTPTADIVKFNGSDAFTSGANAIWDMSGKQHNMWALQRAGIYGNQIVFDTGSAYSPASVLAGCDSALYYFTESYGYCRKPQYDNFYVQHQIPRMDRQYAWFTAAIENYTDMRYWGLMNPYGDFQGQYSSSTTDGWVAYFDFVTSSQFSSYIGSNGQRTWGANPNVVDYSGTLAQPFNNLNWNIYEPVITSSNVGPNECISTPENFMGRPVGTALIMADPSITTYVNRDLVPSSSVPSSSWNSPADHPGVLDEGPVFNSLMLKRNNLYGWSSYNRTRQADHPVLRAERSTNRISFMDTYENLSLYALRPVSLKGRPTYLNIDYTNKKRIRHKDMSTEENITLETTHNNEFIYFNYPIHDKRLQIQRYVDSTTTAFDQLVMLGHSPHAALNWIDYTECVYPALRNEFWSGSAYRQGFDNLAWRDSFWGSDGRFAVGSALSNSLGIHLTSPSQPLGLSQSCWPLDAPANFLTRYSASHIALINSHSSGPFPHTGGAGSITHFGFMYWAPESSAGELQNPYSQTHFSSSNTSNVQLRNTLLFLSMQPGAIYARKHMLDNPRSMNSPNHPHMKYPTLAGANNSTRVQDLRTSVFDFEPAVSPHLADNGLTTATTGAGEAMWEAPQQAGYLKRNVEMITEKVEGSKPITKKIETIAFISQASQPWWNNYDDFKSELKLKARGYSVIPEFRISDHVSEYMNFGLKAASSLDTFEIPHTRYNSSQKEFYRDFSNSDFLKHFLNVYQLSDLDPKEFKITAKAAIRFNPYKGFYPAQRTLDLVSQFSRSYGTGLQVSIPKDQLRDSWVGDFAAADPMVSPARMIYQPLFAPGILYNSIKAGVACDFPIVTDDRKLQRVMYTGSNGHTDGNCEMWAFYPRRSENNALGPMGGNDPQIFSTGTLWDLRVPFEAIITPEAYLAGRTFMDMEPHPSAAFGFSVTASFAPKVADKVYTLMASNFVAEVGDFFLKNRTYSTLRGRGVTSKTQRFSGAEVFGARLRMRSSFSGSRAYNFESSSTGDNTWYSKFGAKSYRVDLYGGGGDTQALGGSGMAVPAGQPAKWQTGEFEIPQDPKQNPYFVKDFVMYNRTTAFGPPFTNLYPGQVDKDDIRNNQHSLYNQYRTKMRGPQILADAPCSNFNDFMSASTSGTMDCHNGYNWAWTPPYYHGEAWCDFLFRPSASVDYTLEMILAETKIKQWRADPGPRTGSEDSNHARYSRTLWNDNAQLARPSVGHNFNRVQNTSPYNSYNINDNAMQLSHSLNLFGIENIYKERIDKFGNKLFDENEIVGKRWVIQPKFETPMLNFADIGVHPISASWNTKALPSNFGSDTVPNGMWHQFGIRPDNLNKGVYLEIGDIPSQWLQYHYLAASESSVYNNFVAPSAETQGKNKISPLHSQMKPYATLMGFDQQNSKVRLGEIAEARILREAIVVVPYYVEGVKPTECALNDNDSTSKKNAQNRKKFLSIPIKKFKAAMAPAQGSPAGDSLDAAGQSIRRLVQKMDKYVLPPMFDFIQNPHVNPMVMYMLEFEYELDADDLSYIWQNLAPREYKKMSFQQDCVSHELINTELMTGQNLLGDPNLRWMVFKVKQKSQTLYTDKVVSQAEQTTQLIQSHEDKMKADQEQKAGRTQAMKDKKQGKNRKDQAATYPILFNWPYDFVSFVELAKVDVEILYKDDLAYKDPDKTYDNSAQKIKEALDNKKRQEKEYKEKTQKEEEVKKKQEEAKKKAELEAYEERLKQQEKEKDMKYRDEKQKEEERKEKLVAIQAKVKKSSDHRPIKKVYKNEAKKKADLKRRQIKKKMTQDDQARASKIHAGKKKDNY